MGYSYYEIDRLDGTPMKRGYGVECKCHHRGCKEQINRGLAFLCFNCTWYFCSNHLTWADCKKHEDCQLVADCFAGPGKQVCEACKQEMENDPSSACEENRV